MTDIVDLKLPKLPLELLGVIAYWSHWQDWFSLAKCSKDVKRYLLTLYKQKEEQIYASAEQYETVINLTLFDNDRNGLSYCNYIKGKENGEDILVKMGTEQIYDYSSDSYLYEECNWLFDKRHGRRYIYNKNANIAFIINYIHDVIHGEFLEYHDNNVLSKSKYYINGKLNSECITYNTGGNIEKKVNYTDGKLHGAEILYDRDGIIREYKNWNMDILEGEYSNTLLVNGLYIMTTCIYKNAEKDGIEYRLTGTQLGDLKVISARTYVDGKLEGPSYYYDEFGHLTKMEMYKDNNLHGDTVVFKYDNLGTLIKSKTTTY